MLDPFIIFHKIKAALISAGLIEQALAMDTVLSLGVSLEQAWELVGRWREIVRSHKYADALASSMRDGDNASANAAHLVRELRRYEKQYRLDLQFGRPATGLFAENLSANSFALHS